MSYDFIEDLLEALNRVLVPDHDRIKELLIINGMPDKTANLRYLSYNRQTFQTADRAFEFSAVAVINNHRVTDWRLEGYRKKLGQLIFNALWTRNPLDLFLNNLRCHPAMTELMASASANFTLLGILTESAAEISDPVRRPVWRIRPVVAIPGLDREKTAAVSAFETASEIRRTKHP